MQGYSEMGTPATRKYPCIYSYVKSEWGWTNCPTVKNRPGPYTLVVNVPDVSKLQIGRSYAPWAQDGWPDTFTLIKIEPFISDDFLPDKSKKRINPTHILSFWTF